MFVHKHHTPFVETMSQPMTQNHLTLRKATDRSFTLCNHRVVWLIVQRRNTCRRSTSIYSCRNRSVNRRAVPPCTCRKTWITHIKSPLWYITHRAMRAPTAMSFAELGASRHTRTPLQIQHDSQSLHLHPTTDSPYQHNDNNDPSIKFLVATSTTKDDSPTRN